jgi:hypothetical protein
MSDGAASGNNSHELHEEDGKPPHFLSSFGTRDAGAFERSCSFDIIVSIL